MLVRTTRPEDIPPLKHVVDEAELFPSEMLPELASGFLENEEKSDLWLTCESEGDVIGFCFAVPEELAEGTWNMLAIAVRTTAQGVGAGSKLTAALESQLRDQGNRILIADTSSTQAFEQTREFYRKNGFTEEARIRDFWATGDDKVVFWKSLG